MLKRAGAAFAGLAGLLLILSAPFIGQAPSTSRADEPVILSQFPEDGDTLKEPPFVLAMCFKNPVNVKDLDKGGDFNFSIVSPDGGGLGVRIVFQPDGYGVALYPNTSTVVKKEGDWSWKYRLTDNATLDPLEGTVKFSVKVQGGSEIISATPASCLAPGATPQPTLIVPGTPGATAAPIPTPKPGETVKPGSPTATPKPGQTAEPHPSGETPESDGDGQVIEGDEEEVDILRLALLTIGAAGAAGLIALIGYGIRRRIGYEPHKPPEDGGDSHNDHGH